MSASQTIVSSAVKDRYATTLFELAQEQGNLTKVEEDARALKAMLAGSADLAAVLANPLVVKAEKAGALAAIAKKAKFQPVTANFLGVVADNGRADALYAIVEGFIGLAASARGAILAEVATATPLTSEQLDDLKASLERAFKSSVDIETSVKPEILGGLTVKVGSRLFDDSIKSKLDALTLAMKGA